MARSRNAYIKKRRSPVWAAVTGAAVGSALTYWFDPETGRRRRASVRDKATRALHDAEDAVGRTSRDIANRARGAVIDVLRPASPNVGDDVLAERVRSELGRVSSHAGAIEVSCLDGSVQLQGPILKSELNRVLHSVARIPGVKEIHDNLEAHRHPDGIPALQESSRAPIRSDGRRGGGASVAAIARSASLALAAYGLVRRTPLSVGAGLAGLAVYARMARDGQNRAQAAPAPIILVDDPEGVVYESPAPTDGTEPGTGEPEHSIH
ncbi:MAG: BON domain-containing protein [Gemmatimonadetes bacterium]|nr:BON domain-containing protein [Gemmatimonadota bacterium]